MSMDTNTADANLLVCVTYGGDRPLLILIHRLWVYRVFSLLVMSGG